ncbi:MAG: Swarming motility protein YbiA [Planctomyces sp.]|nr:Swarming motility protein YbiA [Planctomyces sp.]
MTTPATINFYLKSGEHGYLSNFSPHRVFLKGKNWPTSEHYFQAQKFAGTPAEEKIRLAITAREAANLGRSRKLTLRRDWESVKVNIMREAVLAKFSQHDDLRELLLATGDARLIEHTANDSFWGDGGDGSGKNWLGRILMEVRGQLA